MDDWIDDQKHGYRDTSYIIERLKTTRDEQNILNSILGQKVVWGMIYIYIYMSIFKNMAYGLCTSMYMLTYASWLDTLQLSLTVAWDP